MNNNPFSQDEPAGPVSSSQSDESEQLFLGGQQGTRRVRRPYQYPQSQPQSMPPQPPNNSQRQPPPGSALNSAARGPGWSMPAPPAQYPPHQPGQMSNQPTPQDGKNKSGRPRRRRGCMIGCLTVLILFILLIVALVPITQRVLAFGSAISTQTPLSTQTGYMGGSNRVNILIMGFGGSGHSGAYLTDSMVVMSLVPSTHHTTLISIPRDLWVQNPANSGQYSKLNAVYPVAAGNTNTNPVAGGNATAQKVSLITGLTINYWVTIDFAGFKDFIDAIGGVDVNVPDSFNACYPKNDNASVDASWIKVQFNKGLQHMNGATAIAYARAREPLEVCGMGTSMNQAELTDFARSQRQQLIMQAVLTKLKQWQTWPSLFNAMDKLKKTLYSNLSLADLGAFAMKMDLKDAHRVGLSNQNVLVDATSSDGQAILLPANNDWKAITAYVKQNLYN